MLVLVHPLREIKKKKCHFVLLGLISFFFVCLFVFSCNHLACSQHCTMVPIWYRKAISLYDTHYVFLLLLLLFTSTLGVIIEVNIFYTNTRIVWCVCLFKYFHLKQCLSGLGHADGNLLSFCIGKSLVIQCKTERPVNYGIPLASALGTFVVYMLRYAYLLDIVKKQGVTSHWYACAS